MFFIGTEWEYRKPRTNLSFLWDSIGLGI